MNNKEFWTILKKPESECDGYESTEAYYYIKK